MRRFRNTLKDERDIHSRLMLAYREVPIIWYIAVGVIAFAFLCISIEIFPTQLPIWGAVVAFVLATILSVPLAMLQAITNQQVPTQVMHELIAGYMLPGKPIANMLFKTIAFIGSNQAIGFAGDLKLGHYMKIPPRVMFSVQVVAAVISCFVATGVQDWAFANIEDICTPHQKQGFRCPGSTTFATASVIWGGVGPRRLFSPGQRLVSLLSLSSPISNQGSIVIPLSFGSSPLAYSRRSLSTSLPAVSPFPSGVTSTSPYSLPALALSHLARGLTIFHGFSLASPLTTAFAASISDGGCDTIISFLLHLTQASH
jgi:hypothetical protein